MESHYEVWEGQLVIRVPKELDHHQASQLKLEADLLIEAYQIKKLVFDFGDTEFMDSSGIGMMIGRCRNMGYYGGEVSAINLNQRLKKIFVVSGLHKLIRTDASENEKKEMENESCRARMK